MKPLVFFLMGLTLCLLPACKVDPNVIRASLQTGGNVGASLGLSQWAKKDPADAKQCALALSKNINEVLLPYLNGSNLPSSAEIQAMLNSTLCNGVKPEIKAAIMAASIALDSFLPIPSTTTYLNADQVSYIKAFLCGVGDGCDAFLGNQREIKTTKVPVWLK